MDMIGDHAPPGLRLFVLEKCHSAYHPSFFLAYSSRPVGGVVRGVRRAPYSWARPG